MIRFIRFYVIFWHNIAIEVKDFENVFLVFYNKSRVTQRESNANDFFFNKREHILKVVLS